MTSLAPYYQAVFDEKQIDSDFEVCCFDNKEYHFFSMVNAYWHPVLEINLRVAKHNLDKYNEQVKNIAI